MYLISKSGFICTIMPLPCFPRGDTTTCSFLLYSLILWIDIQLHFINSPGPLISFNPHMSRFFHGRMKLMYLNRIYQPYNDQLRIQISSRSCAEIYCNTKFHMPQIHNQIVRQQANSQLAHKNHILLCSSICGVDLHLNCCDFLLIRFNHLIH